MNSTVAIAAAAALISSFAYGADYPRVDDLPDKRDLPDPLVFFDGTPVRSRDEWFRKRRPEIRALFEYYEYGRAPDPPRNLAAHSLAHDPRALSGKATLDEVAVTFGPEGTPPIHLLVVVPNAHRGRSPVFAGLNFCGNHAVLAHPAIAVPDVWMRPKCKGCNQNRASAAGRGSEGEIWCIENAVEHGYAIATFYCGDVDPDKNDFTDGVHPHYFRPGQSAPGEHDWGTIRAWAWGLSRAVDYLLTRPDIDPARIAAIGHSRLGKTALLAAAFDDRIALVVPHQSGTGGCALSRGNDQETVERINRSFPHWFNDTFPQFAGREERLPVDQHLLMCLVAPRPIFDSEGNQDSWANFNSAYLALRAADRVYKFLGARGMTGTGMIRGDEPIKGPNFGDLVQYRRDTKHTLNREYWNKAFEFADAYYAKRAAP